MTRHTHTWRDLAGYSDLRRGQRCDECGERRRLLYTGGRYVTTETFRARQLEPGGGVKPHEHTWRYVRTESTLLLLLAKLALLILVLLWYFLYAITTVPWSFNVE